MQKKLSLVLGLILLGGSIITISSASRLQYHLYNYPHNTPSSYSIYKVNSSRISPWQYKIFRKVPNKKKTKELSSYSLSYSNALRNSKRENYRTAQERLNAYRTRKIKENARYANNLQSQRFIIRKGQYNQTGYGYKEPKNNNRKFIAVTNKDFTINTGAFKKDSNNTFRAQNTSLAFQISQTPKNYKCPISNFWNCANSLNKNFKSSQSFSSLKEKNTDFRWNQTNNLSFNYFPTVTENFTARAGGQNNSYFIFNALNPKDGSIIRIEGVSSRYDKETAAKIMYQIFESFRFKNT